MFVGFVIGGSFAGERQDVDAASDFPPFFLNFVRPAPFAFFVLRIRVYMGEGWRVVLLNPFASPGVAWFFV